MLSYNEYDKLKKFLKEEKYDKLDEYLDKLCYKTYLETAKKALVEFTQNRYGEYFSYLEDGKLLIANQYCVYTLNNDDILTDYRKQRINLGKGVIKAEILKRILCFRDNIIEKDKIDVTKIEKVNIGDFDHYYELTSIDGYGISTFDIKLFNYASNFLGRDVSYKLVPNSDDKTVFPCFAESDKGNGIILPVKRKVKN